MELIMEIKHIDLKDKISGCWSGKNIGGVLGAPYEEYQRTLHDVKFYAQDIQGNPPGNDDLDLQLVWLNAVEQYGRKVNAHILGQYWLSYIIPNWSEYGMSKRNLRAGMVPPLSGSVENRYKDSNGAWIRTELWACLAPGHPEIAVRYAFEDAIVDHAHEGVYSTVFIAAVESAAFVISDRYELIKIGLSYIPEDCLTAKAVRLVVDCKEKGMNYPQAREQLFNSYPGTFGVSFFKEKDLDTTFPNGEPGMDAPNAIGIIIIGWLYGEDDFDKTLFITVNCGEDTDCTGATIGAIMGIIHGQKAIPEKWLEPLNGVINTCCIDLTTTIDIPKNVDELTKRVIKNIPMFLEQKYFEIDSHGVDVITADSLECPEEYEYIKNIAGHKKSKEISIKTLMDLSPYAVRYSLGTISAILDYNEEPFVCGGESKKITLTLWDSNKHSTPGQFADIKIYTDEGIIITGGNYLSVPLCSTYGTRHEFEIEATVETVTAASMNILFDISVRGSHTGGVIKATFLPGRYSLR